MRWLLVFGVVLGACSKCTSDKAAPDAAVQVAAVTAPDAATVLASGDGDGDGGPTDDTLIAEYAKSCSHVVEQPYYEYDQDKRGDECIARNIDQSCAPDLFDCYSKGEECKKGCGATCQSCSEKCAGSCDTCKAGCEKQPPGHREACVTTCAKARLQCRNGCMRERGTCLASTCATLESTCEDEGNRKRQKACPDCAELGNCMWEPGYKEDHARCLERYPQNAKECLEWCFSE